MPNLKLIENQALAILREKRALQVRHRDGVIGTLICADRKRPGYYLVKFKDGVTSPQNSTSLFIQNVNLSTLLQSSYELVSILSTFHVEIRYRPQETNNQVNRDKDEKSEISCWCTGRDGILKISYESEEKAVEGGKGKPIRLNAYECPRGNGWHLTKRPRESIAKRLGEVVSTNAKDFEVFPKAVNTEKKTICPQCRKLFGSRDVKEYLNGLSRCPFCRQVIA